MTFRWNLSCHSCFQWWCSKLCRWISHSSSYSLSWCWTTTFISCAVSSSIFPKGPFIHSYLTQSWLRYLIYYLNYCTNGFFSFKNLRRFSKNIFGDWPLDIMVTFLKKLLLNATPVDNYLFKVSNRNTRTRREICSKLTIKTSHSQIIGMKPNNIAFIFCKLWHIPMWCLLTKRIVSYTWAQPAFTCSKLSIESLEQGVKYVQTKQ